MSEEIVQRYYYITEFNDEMPPHRPTLEGAAFFLLHGKAYPEETEAFFAERAPLAADGDVIQLDVLELFADRVAIRDGESWRLAPPPPDGAEFFAVRYGASAGWDIDGMGGSLSDIAECLNECLNEDGGDGQYVAVGRHAEVKAVFRVIDGAPSLEVLSAEKSGV